SPQLIAIGVGLSGKSGFVRGGSSFVILGGYGSGYKSLLSQQICNKFTTETGQNAGWQPRILLIKVEESQ
ncbi:MAG: hypothetical protein ACO4B0_17085, partial [bacterium]